MLMTAHYVTPAKQNLGIVGYYSYFVSCTNHSGILTTLLAVVIKMPTTFFRQNSDHHTCRACRACRGNGLGSGQSAILTENVVFSPWCSRVISVGIISYCSTAFIATCAHRSIYVSALMSMNAHTSKDFSHSLR